MGDGVGDGVGLGVGQGVGGSNQLPASPWDFTLHIQLQGEDIYIYIFFLGGGVHGRRPPVHAGALSTGRLQA